MEEQHAAVEMVGRAQGSRDEADAAYCWSLDQGKGVDGTAKGGIVIAVRDKIGIPVKLVGLGEGIDDLYPFEPEAFVDALLEGEE